MFHYVHQVVADFVCLSFGAGQVVYSGLIRAFSLKTAAAAGHNTDESSESELKQKNCSPYNQSNKVKSHYKATQS